MIKLHANYHHTTLFLSDDKSCMAGELIQYNGGYQIKHFYNPGQNILAKTEKFKNS